MKRGIIFLLLMFLLFNISFVFAEDNATTIIQVDLIGFNSSSSDEIGIEVPDKIDLGELNNNNKVSDEEGIQINNTGTIDIRVTPQLVDGDEEIFKWLFFRTQKSDKEGIMNISYKIEDYYLDINKPLTGKTFNHAHCYVQLNLTDFSGRITEDIEDYKTEIVFLATAR
jgi:hypothetical protein